MKRVVVVVVILAALMTGAIAWKIRAQNQALQGPASGSGVIEGDGVNLAARLSARVVRVAVQEGATIEEGAVLMELDCDEPQARLAEAEARLEAARAQAEAARDQAQAAHRQSSAARASVAAARARVGAAGAQRDVAEREAHRVEAMGAHAALSRRNQAQAAATGLEAQASAAEASRTAASRQASAASAQADAASSQADAAERSVAALEAIVRTAHLMVDECTIRAPKAGVVERVYYDPGELVMPGSTVARIIDPTTVKATFYLPNADLAAAEVGMHTRVVADAYPGQHFTGIIDRIALEAEFTPRNIQTRERSRSARLPGRGPHRQPGREAPSRHARHGHAERGESLRCPPSRPSTCTGATATCRPSAASPSPSSRASSTG